MFKRRGEEGYFSLPKVRVSFNIPSPLLSWIWNGILADFNQAGSESRDFSNLSSWPKTCARSLSVDPCPPSLKALAEMHRCWWWPPRMFWKGLTIKRIMWELIFNIPLEKRIRLRGVDNNKRDIFFKTKKERRGVVILILFLTNYFLYQLNLANLALAFLTRIKADLLTRPLSLIRSGNNLVVLIIYMTRFSTVSERKRVQFYRWNPNTVLQGSSFWSHPKPLEIASLIAEIKSGYLYPSTDR